MGHLSDGTLRRMVDEPLAIGGGDRLHFDTCSPCQDRSLAISDEAVAANRLFTLPDFTPSPEAALALTRSRIQRMESAHPVTWQERVMARARLRWPRVARPVAVLLVAAGVLGAFTASGIVPNLLKVFEPKQFQGIQVSPSQLNPAQLALEYGTVTWTPGPPEVTQVSTAAAAQAASGLPVLMPASLPGGIPPSVSYASVSRATGSFTFNAATLQASAARAGVRVSPMPSSVNGSTLTVDAGPGLIELYGGALPAASGAGGEPPVLIIVQTRTPTVYSTGATAKQLEDYVLGQPGMPPELVAQVRAIKDPATTLPIPIPAGLATSRQVQVQRVHGLLVDAGLVSGVVWQKNGIIYAVGGQLTADQVLSIANSLH